MRVWHRVALAVTAGALALVGTAAPASAAVTYAATGTTLDGIPSEGGLFRSADLTWTGPALKGVSYQLSIFCGFPAEDGATQQYLGGNQYNPQFTSNSDGDGWKGTERVACYGDDSGYILKVEVTATNPRSWASAETLAYFRDRPQGSLMLTWVYGKKDDPPACVLTPEEMAKVARGAGFRGNDLTTAVAVAMSESSLDSYATNLNDNGSTDFGLFQVNNQAHPQYATDLLTKSPTYNTKAALSVKSSAGGFSPWVAFTSGAYATNRDVAAQAVAATATETPNALIWNDCAAEPQPVQVAADGSVSPGVDPTSPLDEECDNSPGFLTSLKCFFTPRQATLDSFMALRTTAADKFPFSIPRDFIKTAEQFAPSCEQGNSCGYHSEFYVKMPGGKQVMVWDSSYADPNPTFVTVMREHRDVLGVLVWMTAFGPLVWAIFWGSVPLLNLKRVSDNASGNGGRSE